MPGQASNGLEPPRKGREDVPDLWKAANQVSAHSLGDSRLDSQSFVVHGGINTWVSRFRAPSDRRGRLHNNVELQPFPHVDTGKGWSGVR